MSITLRFKSAPPTAPSVAEHLLAQSTSTSSTTTRTYTFATPTDLHTFQHHLSGSTVLFDATASAFLVARRAGTGLRAKKEDRGAARLQLLRDGGDGDVRWRFLAYFGREEGEEKEEDGRGQAAAMCFAVDAKGVFEYVNGGGKGGRFGIRLLDVVADGGGGAGSDDQKKASAFLCLGVAEEQLDHSSSSSSAEREDVTLLFEREEVRDRLAEVLPAPVKKPAALGLRGALHLR